MGAQDLLTGELTPVAVGKRPQPWPHDPSVEPLGHPQDVAAPVPKSRDLREGEQEGGLSASEVLIWEVTHCPFHHILSAGGEPLRHAHPQTVGKLAPTFERRRGKTCVGKF